MYATNETAPQKNNWAVKSLVSLRLKSWHENCRLFCWMRLMFCPLFRYGFEKTREKSCNNKQTKFDCILYGLIVPLAQSTWI